MQLTRETLALYTGGAAELRAAVVDSDHGLIMRRDPSTDYCVKFDSGLCTIHRDYGEAFLGDACNLYPRITRALDDVVFTTAALSCPEAARLMLFLPDGFDLTPREELRVPFSLKNYLPDGLSPDAAMQVHMEFVREAGNESFSAEHNVMRLSAVVRALETQKTIDWPGATPFYFKMAEGRIPPQETDVADLHKLLNALRGLMVASQKNPSASLLRTVERMAEALGATLDWDQSQVGIRDDALERSLRLLHYWNKEAAKSMQPVLRRYLMAQVSQALFPFAGLGNTLSERIVIIGVRFATVKLALMSEAALTNAPLPEAETIRIIQSLSRFQDHLATAELSLAIYEETGWTKDARLRALVGD